MPEFEAVVKRLKEAFHDPLPGARAHELLSPRPRREWPEGFDPAQIRHAAGLLLVFPIHDSAHILLTLRADHLGRHGGQISLPGGVLEPGETFEQAALREAREEVGLDHGGIRVLGALTPLDIPVTGFRLHPIVATRPTRPSLTPADAEVAQILEITVDDLLDRSHIVSTMRQREGRSIIAPAYAIAGVEIWGATAMVLAEFAALLS
jgi:8-oxo-dGTP pyrophosphatase MutT (NUDIX family)